LKQALLMKIKTPFLQIGTLMIVKNTIYFY